MRDDVLVGFENSPESYPRENSFNSARNEIDKRGAVISNDVKDLTLEDAKTPARPPGL